MSGNQGLSSAVSQTTRQLECREKELTASRYRDSGASNDDNLLAFVQDVEQAVELRLLVWIYAICP